MQQIDESEGDIDSLTANEITKKVKDLGMKTKLRSFHKLKEFFQDSLTNKENQPISNNVLV